MSNSNMKTTVFLVENDDVEAERVTRAFVKSGAPYTIERAWDGLEALEKLRDFVRNAAIPRFIILLDLKMPRMNGIEFLDALRSDPSLKYAVVFVLTTSRDETDLKESYARNIAGYILKTHISANFQEVTQMLNNYCDLVDFPQGNIE